MICRVAFGVTTGREDHLASSSNGLGRLSLEQTQGSYNVTRATFQM